MTDDIRYDFLGQQLNIGDYVVYGGSMQTGRVLYLSKIEKFTPKQIICKRVNTTHRSMNDRLYQHQVLKVDEKLVFEYMMKK